VTVREFIEPLDGQLRYGDVFRSPLPPSFPLPVTAESPILPADELFGERPAVIPLWQLRRLLGAPEAAAIAIVGNRVGYIPAGTGAAERRLLRAAMRQFGVGGAERPRSPERARQRRVELTAGRIPAAVRAFYRERKAAEEAGSWHALAGRSPGPGSRLHAEERERRYALRAEGRIIGVCTVTVHPFRTVAVAQRPLEAGEVIKLDTQPRRAIEPAGLPAGGPEYPLQGRYRLRRAVPAGTPLGSAVLDREPAVRASARVEVVLREGGIVLRVPGRALASGGLGQQIPVRLATGGRVEARITGNGLLERVR
jgi:flagella basal body P-ring formation protein FlgA